MNIDYGKIIETANKRKETLEQLAELLKDAPDIYAQAVVVYDWMVEVQQTYQQLDREGHQLLPEAVRAQLGNFPVTYMKLILNTGATHSPANIGLETLVAALRAGS